MQRDTSNNIENLVNEIQEISATENDLHKLSENKIQAFDIQPIDLSEECKALRNALVSAEMQRIALLDQKNKIEKQIKKLHGDAAKFEKKMKEERLKVTRLITQKKILEKSLLQKEEKIRRMENWKVMRLGRAIMACRSFKGLLQLPLALWNLHHSAPLDKKNIAASLPESSIEQARELPMDTEISMLTEKQDWLAEIQGKIFKIQNSNGTRYYQKSSCRIGLVCDEFFYEAICDAADFVYTTPSNWMEVLDGGIDVFLFVSTWRGLNGEWKGVTLSSLERYKEEKFEERGKITLSATRLHPCQKAAFELLEECRRRNVPTIFYSKEDPPNYWLFLDYAKKCDYIFTSAKECIESYKEHCGHNRVESICFGINPHFHNPIGLRSIKKEKEVFFSGSWMKKYPARCAELAEIFDGILQAGHGLRIIDRNYQEGQKQNKRYQFPKRYLPYTYPAVSHDILQKVHKLSNWAININSVKISETMFANRTFELQANGILLLSNFSVGVNSILPNIYTVAESSEIKDILSSFTDEELYERQISGIRSVMTNHTCYDRIAALLNPAGIKIHQPIRSILVLAEELTENVKICFDRQTYSNKVLRLSTDVYPKDLASYDMITWFATNAEYEEFYLEDMANGFKYTSCDYITKDSWFEGQTLHSGVEHGYVTLMRSKFRTLFWRDAFDPQFILDLKGEMALDNGYSIDHFNFNAIPIEYNSSKKHYLLSVIIPVYNNGPHLYGKCFSSLRRSSLFNDMEIILVDDGSTDIITRKIESWLIRHYSNIRIFVFDDGGSGSASRPRNKGVEIASASYITFLDPDNEAVCDGYAKLYDKAVKGDYDLVLGNMYKTKVTTRLTSYYDKIVKTCNVSSFEHGFSKFLKDIDFMAPSIQAMVIRRELIQKNGLEQVVGAAGQDTLFSWQLMHHAERMSVMDLPIHIYYAQTTGSVTNTVGANFFKKLLLLQQPKVDWLNASNNMNDFMESRYDFYTCNWIMQKLSTVSTEEAHYCIKIVEKILEIYNPYYKRTSSLINTFMDFCKEKNYSRAFACVQEAFPLHRESPIPSLEEMLSIKRKVMNVEFEQKGTVFTFYNISNSDHISTYAWVILSAEGKYNKIYQEGYTHRNTFTYDFSIMKEDTYKVRAFISNNNGKISEDIAYIECTSKGEVLLIHESSTVTLKKENNNEYY